MLVLRPLRSSTLQGVGDVPEGCPAPGWGRFFGGAFTAAALIGGLALWVHIDAERAWQRRNPGKWR